MAFMAFGELACHAEDSRPHDRNVIILGEHLSHFLGFCCWLGCDLPVQCIVAHDGTLSGQQCMM